MIFTLYYMYATLLQWWRLGCLKNKLNGTFNSQNALLICNEGVLHDTKRVRSFENLLFRNDDRVGCTIVPRQKICLSHWISFPRDYRYFPIYFNNHSTKLLSPNIYILVQAMLETYVKHSADLLELEKFGDLIAWKASDNFEAILKTDLDKLTKLVHCYSQGDIDINHELKLLKIETIDIEGIPTKIKFDRKYSKESTLKYSHAPVHWRKFVENVKELYARIRDSTNPKITIENGKPEDTKKVPVSEVKPIKKDSRKYEDKNTLEVAAGDYRRHKSSDHKREKSSDKHKTVEHGSSKNESRTRDEHKHKAGKSQKDPKVKGEDKRDNTKDLHKKSEEKKDNTKESHKNLDQKNDNVKDSDKKAEDKAKMKRSERESKKTSKHASVEKDKCKAESSSIPRTETKVKKDDVDAKETKEPFLERHKRDNKPSKSKYEKLKTDLEKASKSDKSKSDHKVMSKRSTSSEKKLVKSMAVCDDLEADVKNDEETSKCTNTANVVEKSQDLGISRMSSFDKVKPPNILVFADSLVAKENVKSAMSSMLNIEKYTMYDLPTDPNQTMWYKSTVLVVVCGTVPPDLTAHLLQYLLNGGQLLCLCSDLLYSVLHNFTTAEVREHELVRFTYGKWKQVRMMHHIFCYQASPAKKQFSKDSDHSNQSSGNGSSPVAPRTPSIVEIQHNGKDYLIQVQVLGTEETWQTPSLLLATVKGGEGRAVFSQVHLEINPNQYEDDESKFEALKESDLARMEILRDILSNHLDIDCTTTNINNYTPAFFLGRHEMKMKLLNDCESIKDNRLTDEKLVVKFCGKDEIPDSPSSNYLPVYIHSCPTNFSTVTYFETLNTEHIGRLVIYSDVLASTHFVLNQKLEHGLVVIARQQLLAKGRSDNIWISPLGSASFSMQLHIPLESPLGRYLPLVQQLTAVAILSAIDEVRGCSDLEIGIKWPNDIIANGTIKIGGHIVTSSCTEKIAIVNVGAGLNLSNVNPTMCVNELIRLSNERSGTNMQPISFELYFTSVFNEFERIYNIIQDGNIDYLFDLYYRYWLHNNATEVTVIDQSGLSERGKITGIDDYGFLRVKLENGSIKTVLPDGNKFDMLAGLIYPKTF